MLIPRGYGMLYAHIFILCIRTDSNLAGGRKIFQGLSAALLFPQVYASLRVNFNPLQAKKHLAIWE